MCLSQLDEVASIIQALATVAALGLGGAWSFWLFVKNRQIYPSASIVHHITHRDIGEGKSLLHVDVVVSNVGDVLVSLIESETRVQQVLPLPASVQDTINSGQDPVPEGKTEVEWPLIDSHEQQLKKGQYEIEPGGSQQINHDFILDADVETIEVYSHVVNEKKRPRKLGWDLTSLYDLAAPE